MRYFNRASVWNLLAAISISFCTTSFAADTAAVEVYRHRHREVEMGEGSPAWDALPAAERERYLKDTEGEGRSGKPAEASDLILLKKTGPDKMAFCLLHVGHLLHMCFISGVGTQRGDEIVYTDPKNPKCMLRIVRAGQSINVYDDSGDCRDDYCGARASLQDDISFSPDDRVTDEGKSSEALSECELPTE